MVIPIHKYGGRKHLGECRSNSGLSRSYGRIQPDNGHTTVCRDLIVVFRASRRRGTPRDFLDPTRLQVTGCFGTASYSCASTQSLMKLARPLA